MFMLAGAVPIKHMRHLMSTGKLSDALIDHINSVPRK